MTDKQLFYYAEMLRRNRLVPILMGNKLRAFITYYLCTERILKNYTDRDPWTVVDDTPATATICYIDQLITNKQPDNYRYSFSVFKDFINYIRDKYPKIQSVQWRRYKGGKVHTFQKSIRGGKYVHH